MKHVGLRSSAKDIASQEQLSAGLKNLLINGNFAINQRAYVSGTATISANQYTLDRWRVVTSGQNLVFAAAGNGNQVTAPAGGVEQVIEGLNISGGTYALSWVGTATAAVNGSAVANGATVTLPANTNATVRFSGTVSLAQLELGAVSTQFEHRPYGLEFSLCLRYGELVTTGWITGFSPAVAVLNLQWQVQKRAAPTLSLIAGGAAAGAGLSNGITAISSISASVKGAFMDLTGASGWNATASYSWRGGSIFVSSEL